MSAANQSTDARAGNVAFVVAMGSNVGSRLCQGLVHAGSRVALLEDGRAGAAGAGDSDSPAGQTADGTQRYPTSLASRTEVLRAFDAAARDLGSPRLVLVSALPPSLLIPADSERLNSHEWASAVHGAAKVTLYCLQAAHSHMVKSGGGTIVCVGPSFALVGAARLLGLSTVLEAQRALVKSAARQWGRHGIRAHWIALGVGANYPALQGVPLPNGPELGPPPPPLGRIPDFDDVAGIAEFLASSAGRGLTGASLVADGGDWMVP
jgi:NAD(P)-dependent dehydrogenase (short-subunit alcohol dehydrogenase family)